MYAIFAGLALMAQIPATEGPQPPTGHSAAYQHWKLGLTNGYKEKKLAANRWRVDAQSGNNAIKDLALLSSLYRAAVITKAAGHSRFFTAKMEIENQLPGGLVEGQEVYSTIILHDNAISPPPCEANSRWVENCRDNSADEVIATVGPLLGQDATTLEAEISEIQARYYSAP